MIGVAIIVCSWFAVSSVRHHRLAAAAAAAEIARQQAEAERERATKERERAEERDLAALDDGTLPNEKLAVLKDNLREKLSTLSQKYSQGGLGAQEQRLFWTLLGHYLHVVARSSTNELHFHEGIARLELDDDMPGYIYVRTNRSLVSPVVFSYAGDFKDGIAKVWKVANGVGSYGFLNKSGRYVDPPADRSGRPEEDELDMQAAVARQITGLGNWDKAREELQQSGTPFGQTVSGGDALKMTLKTAEFMLNPLRDPN